MKKTTPLQKLRLLLKIVFCSLSLSLAVAARAQILPPGTVDFSGVDAFWKVSESLQLNKLPAESAWDSLFNTPCYAYLRQNENRNVLMQRFIKAYLPSNEESKTSAQNPYEERIKNHLITAGHQRKSIERFVDSLRRIDLLKNSLPLTQQYLPDGFVKDKTELYPPIAFGIFEPDGKADGEIIVIDAAFAMDIDLTKFLAHEAHHFFMSKIRSKMRKAPEGVEEILRSIRQLHLEGIADLIDKRSILATPATLTEKDDWYAFHYKNHFNNAKKTFSSIDSLLSVCSDSVDLPLNGGKIWRSLHFGTHPEALHMSLLIEDTFGRDSILASLKNPFDYFRLYREAAIKDPGRGHVFSEKSMNYLERLEKEYLLL